MAGLEVESRLKCSPTVGLWWAVTASIFCWRATALTAAANPGSTLGWFVCGCANDGTPVAILGWTKGDGWKQEFITEEYITAIGEVNMALAKKWQKGKLVINILKWSRWTHHNFPSISPLYINFVHYCGESERDCYNSKNTRLVCLHQ